MPKTSKLGAQWAEEINAKDEPNEDEEVRRTTAATLAVRLAGNGIAGALP